VEQHTPQVVVPRLIRFFIIVFELAGEPRPSLPLSPPLSLGQLGYTLGGARNFSGRREPSSDDTSRMMREYQVRICEGLGVKFPGPTRQFPPSSPALGCLLSPGADMVRERGVLWSTQFHSARSVCLAQVPFDRLRRRCLPAGPLRFHLALYCFGLRPTIGHRNVERAAVPENPLGQEPAIAGRREAAMAG
jgi:hypothetical protein